MAGPNTIYQVLQNVQDKMTGFIEHLTMRAIGEKLPPGSHARVHKFFIVMTDKISSICNDMVRIKDKEIPLSPIPYKQVASKILEKIICHIFLSVQKRYSISSYE
ncbi:LytTR family transcriptional regulator DNA-binding domain-containing protein [Pinibacter aurantiacus]|uniref:LytTR family transcriptional regulator DNA-binding domain-containing protein n=1 Tax=Pinibacter aurantiacus TaxID=2851599 RepID=A0A9E2S3I2_9BACT|nr:LytTR family transcriptional regulator DNA-binding domain-containing protein [Pinibacter aurantiacus]MBV4355928.1 LytTR family transcriptional regulator DNA-binding domain-containing protein [Pinibacter aurantiacus]